MYYKEGNAIDSFKLPILNQPVGFDLKVGDWVKPYGKGDTVDFLATLRSHESDTLRQCHCLLTFPNPLDGILEHRYPQDDHSSYKWPFLAPERGYKKTLVLSDWMYEKNGDAGYWRRHKERKNNGPFIIRTRTTTNAEGELVSAHYSRISNMESIWLTYWFNPDGTRNLEWDKAVNLFERKNRLPGTKEAEVGL